MQLPSCFLFQGLSESQINQLIAISVETQIEKGQWLFQEGKAADRLFLLKDGVVELFSNIESGIEIPIAIFRTNGGCFGTAALIAPYEYSLSARAAVDSTLFLIKQTDLKKLMREDRQLGCILMTNLAQHLFSRLKETRQELKVHFKAILSLMHA
jgi:CRP/FNR family transcriptional regulator